MLWLAVSYDSYLAYNHILIHKMLSCRQQQWWYLVIVINIRIQHTYYINAFCELGIPKNNNHKRPSIPSNSFAHQSSIKDGFTIRQASDDKGMGAFATIAISKGDTLGEYTGELLTRRDVEARYWGLRKTNKHDRKWKNSRRRRNQGVSGDYLFDMGNDNFIDGEDADVSSWCRFANHAADPNDNTSDNGEDNDDDDDDELLPFGDCNAEARARLSWDEDENQVRRLFLVALRDIEPLEEICYDYGGEFDIKYSSFALAYTPLLVI